MTDRKLRKETVNQGIIDAIKTHLEKKKDAGERADTLVKTVAKLQRMTERYVWMHIVYMHEKPPGDADRILRIPKGREIWYYLPCYKKQVAPGAMGGRVAHKKDIQEKILGPVLDEIQKIRILWNGVFIAKVHTRHHTCQDETIKTNDLILITGNRSLRTHLLRVAKKDHGTSLIDKLWDDFLENHAIEQFGNPRKLLLQFETQIKSFWTLHKDLLSTITRLITRNNIGKYVTILVDNKHGNIQEYAEKRIALFCLAYLYKLVGTEREDLLALPYDKGFSQIITKTDEEITVTTFGHDPFDLFIKSNKPLHYTDFLFPYDKDIPHTSIDKFIKSDFMDGITQIQTKLEKNLVVKEQLIQCKEISVVLLEMRTKLIDVFTNYLIADLQGQCPYTD